MNCKDFMLGRESKNALSGCLSCGEALSVFIEEVFDSRFGVDGYFNICQCKSCGLIQLSLCPSLGELKRLYETYYNFGGNKEGLYTRLRTAFLGFSFHRLWLAIDGDICFHKVKGSGRLIDIGCNEGRGLKIYQQNGFDAEGLELNKRAVVEVRKGGFQVYTDLLEEFQPEEPYDVVVLSHVLEHSLHPKETLTDVARILKPGGQVWISCPNVKSWQRRFFGGYWINWHVPFHIVHFSKDTLAKMLRESDFKIQETRQESPALWMTQSLIARLFAKSGLPTKQLRNPLLIASLTLLIRGFLFPVLWLGNRFQRGDCQVVIAKKV